MKIAVYAICKNEQQFVQRFCDSAREADCVLIADTGSTDETAMRARDCGAVVHDICVSPWRFDLARNAALALVPRDIDVCVSLDLDEVLMPGWRAEIERVWIPGDTTRLRYRFDWGADILFYYDKIHARHGYRWHHPVHEFPVPDLRIVEKTAHTDALLVRHLPDAAKPRSQYLDLLRLSVKEDPSCPRNAFYFARELTLHSLWDEAEHALMQYLDLPDATWPNERCYAMRLLSQTYAALGRHDLALYWARRACAEAPGTREPWVELALNAHARQEWLECHMAASMALNITRSEAVYTYDPTVWGSCPHDLASVAAWHLGRKHEALDHARRAVAYNPDDERLQANLALIERDLNGT